MTNISCYVYLTKQTQNKSYLCVVVREVPKYDYCSKHICKIITFKDNINTLDILSKLDSHAKPFYFLPLSQVALDELFTNSDDTSKNCLELSNFC